MKKLMIAAAVAMLGIAANAASCTWSTMAMNAGMSTTINSGKYWLIALGEDVDAASNFKVYSDGTYDFGTYSVVDNGSIGVGGGIGSKITGLGESDNGTYYSLVIWDGAAEGSFYGAATGAITGIKAEPPTDANMLMFDNSGLGAGILLANQSSPDPAPVPEPTTGLLVLVGLAGVALKRKLA